MIMLNHTVIPAKDKDSAAQFFAELFGLTYKPSDEHFATVYVNDDLMFDFDTRDSFEWHHYAFHVSEEVFDAIWGRVKAKGLPYGSGPMAREDMAINHLKGGRGVYFEDTNGHVYELLTVRHDL